MEENRRPTQCDRVIQYMTAYGSITQFDAFGEECRVKRYSLVNGGDPHDQEGNH